MEWTDYKKAYDMVPHAWMIEAMKMVGIADSIVNLYENSKETWRIELTACSLIQTVRIFSDNVGIVFGLDKCTVLVLKKGKMVRTEGIELPEGKCMRG